MIKIVHKNLSGVSNMADQGRIILRNYCLCNLSIIEIRDLQCLKYPSVPDLYFILSAPTTILLFYTIFAAKNTAFTTFIPPQSGSLYCLFHLPDCMSRTAAKREISALSKFSLARPMAKSNIGSINTANPPCWI